MTTTIKQHAGPMTVALDLYLTMVRVGAERSDSLKNLFKQAEKADAALLAQDQEPCGFLLIVNDEPFRLFATLEDANKGADEAHAAGAINIDDEVCQIVEFKAGMPVCTSDDLAGRPEKTWVDPTLEAILDAN